MITALISAAMLMPILAQDSSKLMEEIHIILDEMENDKGVIEEEEEREQYGEYDKNAPEEWLHEYEQDRPRHKKE